MRAAKSEAPWHGLLVQVPAVAVPHADESEPEQEETEVTPPVVEVLAAAAAPPNGVLHVPVPAVAPD
jgi:hypothetical protein